MRSRETAATRSTPSALDVAAWRGERLRQAGFDPDVAWRLGADEVAEERESLLAFHQNGQRLCCRREDSD